MATNCESSEHISPVPATQIVFYGDYTFRFCADCAADMQESFTDAVPLEVRP